MYRVSFLAVFLLLSLPVIVSIPAHADTTNDKCTAFETQKKKIDQNIVALKQKYPDITAFYGLNSFMVRAEMHDTGAYFIIKIAESVGKCTKKMDSKKCNLAAGEIIRLIKSGIDMCKASNENNCNIC